MIGFDAAHPFDQNFCTSGCQFCAQKNKRGLFQIAFKIITSNPAKKLELKNKGPHQSRLRCKGDFCG